MARVRPKMSYAERAKRRFLRGTAFTSPHAAIQQGARTDEEWAAYLEGQKYRAAFESGLKGRQQVKSRHPMGGDKMREPNAKPSEQRKRLHSPADIAEFERRAKHVNQIGGLPAERSAAQARFIYGLFLEFQQIGVLGAGFTYWLAKQTGLSEFTCRHRLKLGRYLATQGELTISAHQAVAEQRRIEKTPRPDLEWGDDDG